MRFLVDMPLSPSLAAWLLSMGHDAVHASEAGMATAPDSEILIAASNDERVIVTADLDYPRLLALSQQTPPGLILFRDGDWNEKQVRDRFEALLATMPAEDIGESIVVVEHDRIRRRRLPVSR